jgi:predicted DCC family thiol-disulfide oxidoreductase YuxK
LDSGKGRGKGTGKGIMSQHLVFYDGECGFCDNIVQLILKQDTRGLFDFAPLQGTTAAKMLRHLPEEIVNNDSLILIENYKTPHQRYYVLGKGAFRICWLLGGAWAIPGLISFLPSFLYDWGYRLVARNRKNLFKNASCVVPTKEKKEHFLP